MSKITLQGPESSGGEVAEGGFNFQNNVILFYIPIWLNDDSFTGFVREAMGDFEVKFFAPSVKGCYVCDLIEAKNHSIQSNEFWKEIKRFRELGIGSSGMYRYYVIASREISKNLSPVANSLRRIKGPYAFYGQDSSINKSSFDSFKDLVIKLGGSEDDAQFLFDKVIIKDDFGPLIQGEALFIQSLSENLPEYGNLPHAMKKTIFLEIKNFVNINCNRFIVRKELENLIRNCIDTNNLPQYRSVNVFTSISDDEINDSDAINLDWSHFWGGEDREYPDSEIWNDRLVAQLKNTKEWILKYHNSRTIRLSGNRRLSSAIATGHVFSAVSGFNINLDYRGKVCSTDAHAMKDTPDYNIEVESNGKNGDEAVVSIGIIHNISKEVETYLDSVSLTDFPSLHIRGDNPIISPEQANKVVQEVKKLINEFVSKSGSRKIHLFFAGPSFLALFLGHRLNATASIQCYERISTNVYCPTCLLSCN